MENILNFFLNKIKYILLYYLEICFYKVVLVSFMVIVVWMSDVVFGFFVF